MITVRAYDARTAWTFGGFGDDSDYPGKIRALAAAFADRWAIYCYSARRCLGLPALLADLIATLWAVFPVLPTPVDVTTLPTFRVVWPAGWSLCSSDRLTTRRTTGPPARGLWSSAPGVCVFNP